MGRTIIGLTGSLCAGKGMAASNLIKKGFQHLVLSDRIRDEIRSRGQTITRSLLQDVGNELRETFGGAILAERTAELICSTSNDVVIDGVRNPDEILYLRNVLDAKIIGVDARREIRLARYLARAKERGEDGTTEEDFNRDDCRDRGIGEPGTGQQVGKCLKMADVILENNDTKEEFHKECDLFLKEILGFDPEIHPSHLERK